MKDKSLRRKTRVLLPDFVQENASGLKFRVAEKASVQTRKKVWGRPTKRVRRIVRAFCRVPSWCHGNTRRNVYSMLLRFTNPPPAYSASLFSAPIYPHARDPLRLFLVFLHLRIIASRSRTSYFIRYTCTVMRVRHSRQARVYTPQIPQTADLRAIFCPEK